jgi:acetylornithine deacetylase/succinyl-diaminopimelate desuccinylase-like protein
VHASTEVDPVNLRALSAVALAIPGWVAAASALGAGTLDPTAFEADAIRLVQEYVRIDTTNPPGNEVRAVEFFARIFEAEGIPYESAESAPGRGNIWARLEGGAEPALVLLHHSDVVPADAAYWDVDPLSGVERDGYIYGRGTLDTKALGILHLQAFLALHRSGAALARDVLFVATADEEAGGSQGAGWLVENRPELFRDAGLLLNEGGISALRDGRVTVQVEVTQKVPLWLRLVARDVPGHGSVPRATSAVSRLVLALARIQAQPSEPRIVPAVDAFFKAIAQQAGDEWQGPFSAMREAVRDPELLKRLQAEKPSLHALTRDTCSITVLQGSGKINVVPPEARAELDCRLLPDADPDAFVARLTALIDDPSVEIERILSFSPAVSGTDTELYRAIVDVTRRHLPAAAIAPSVAAGFTDSHFFRDLGIASYGYAPMVVPESDLQGIHGNNERISLENVKRGARMLLEIVERVAVAE